MSDLPQECAVDDCLRPAHSGGKHCAAHAKQNQRGGITHAPIRDRMPLRERVSHLCDELANADSEDDKARAKAWDRLRKAIEEWAHALRQERAGRARMLALSQEQRSALARRAVKARSRKLAKARRIAIATKAAHARAKSMTASERAAVAKMGAETRWNACSPARLASKQTPESTCGGDALPAPQPGNGRAPERG